MPTLSSKLVMRPKLHKYCDDCGCLVRTHISCFGSAEVGDAPYTIRYCLRCADNLQSEDITDLIEKFRDEANKAHGWTQHWDGILKGLNRREIT